MDYLLGSDNNSPDKELEQKDSIEYVLASLSEDDRQLVRGIYWEDKKMKDIAQELLNQNSRKRGISQSACTWRHKRVLNKIRKLLGS